MDMTVRILKWEKHNPRKDVKRPSWFAFDNRMVEDDDFFSFNHGEFKAWIYLLSKASEKQDPVVRLSFEAAHRKANISPKDFRSAIEKLVGLGIVTVDVTDTSRARHAHVTDTSRYITDRQTDITLHNKHADPNVSVRAAFDLESLYALFPRKEGKAKGLEKLRAVIKTAEDFEKVRTAITRYAAHVQSTATEAKYIKHFSTFMTSWTDWLDPDAGTTTVAKSMSASDQWLAKFGEGSEAV